MMVVITRARAVTSWCSLTFLLISHSVGVDMISRALDSKPSVTAAANQTASDVIARSRPAVEHDTDVTRPPKVIDTSQGLFKDDSDVTNVPYVTSEGERHSGYDQHTASVRELTAEVLGRQSTRAKLHLNAVFLLAAKDVYLFSPKRVLPAIEVAKRSVLRTYLRDVNVTVRYSDSMCNSRDAPIALFNFYWRHEVDVVFGPVCDYSLAPVARYTPVWNIPVITSGGFVHDFDNKRNPQSEYSTLTRVGPNFHSMAEYLLHLLHTFGWRKLQLLYDIAGKDYVMDKFCYLAASTIVHASKTKRMDNDFHIYLPDAHDIGKMLTEKVGLKHAGKCFAMTTDRVL